MPPRTLVVALCVILSPMCLAATAEAQPLKGSAMHGTVTQRATIGGTLNGTRLMLEVSRIDDGANHRTWLSYEIYDTPPGGSEPTQFRIRVAQQIADGDFDIQPHVSRVHTIATDGTHVDIDWTITDAVHLQYDATWRNTTNGTTTKVSENRDTRSATLTGTLLGIALTPRTGFVETFTQQP